LSSVTGKWDPPQKPPHQKTKKIRLGHVAINKKTSKKSEAVLAKKIDLRKPRGFAGWSGATDREQMPRQPQRPGKKVTVSELDIGKGVRSALGQAKKKFSL